ncbi:hypothetical protein I4555_14455 [Proteus mirabilis]|nr:hypothetical protein [Proteus mirabilis]MBG6014408.1 hypothetical protein [Proteus mirabilis]
MKFIILFSLVTVLIFILMFFFIVTGILEASNFDSTKFDNWSGLFSIINVLLTSALSFTSLMILIATLKNTQKMTKSTFDALVNQREDNHISQIESLCQRFNQTLDKENTTFGNSVDCYFDTMISDWNHGTADWIIENKIKSHELVLEHCKSISINYIGRINTETDLLLSILRSLSSISDLNKNDIARAIIKDSIDAERRFWFCCMVDEKSNHEFFTHLANFTDFMIMNESLSHEVFMQEVMSTDS